MDSLALGTGDSLANGSSTTAIQRQIARAIGQAVEEFVFQLLGTSNS